MDQSGYSWLVGICGGFLSAGTVMYAFGGRDGRRIWMAFLAMIVVQSGGFFLTVYGVLDGMILAVSGIPSALVGAIAGYNLRTVQVGWPLLPCPPYAPTPAVVETANYRDQAQSVVLENWRIRIWRRAYLRWPRLFKVNPPVEVYVPHSNDW